MNELSLHILDLVQNAITAGAKQIAIEIIESIDDDILTIIIKDDGCGMEDELLNCITSPFSTTRTTRKVGLGIPMLQQAAMMCDGKFEIVSKPAVGTCIKASFQLSHIDLAPMGDITGTILTLVNGASDGINYKLYMKRVNQFKESIFEFNTQEIRAAIKGLSLNTPEILSWITEYLQEGIASLTLCNT